MKYHNQIYTPLTLEMVDFSQDIYNVQFLSIVVFVIFHTLLSNSISVYFQRICWSSFSRISCRESRIPMDCDRSGNIRCCHGSLERIITFMQSKNTSITLNWNNQLAFHKIKRQYIHLIGICLFCFRYLWHCFYGYMRSNIKRRQKRCCLRTKQRN